MFVLQTIVVIVCSQTFFGKTDKTDTGQDFHSYHYPKNYLRLRITNLSI